MDLGEITGWLAAALTLVTFSMRSMIALRLLAIAANTSFIAYGALVALMPVLILHLLLLPCNLARLWQLLAEVRSRNAATHQNENLGGNPFGNGRWHHASLLSLERDWLLISSAQSPHHRTSAVALRLCSTPLVLHKRGDIRLRTSAKHAAPHPNE